MELNYSNRESDQLLAPVGTFGGWLTGATHPDNPFGTAKCASEPLCTTPQAVATSRRLTESGGRRFTQDVNTWRISAGLDGELPNSWISDDPRMVGAEYFYRGMELPDSHIERVRLAALIQDTAAAFPCERNRSIGREILGRLSENGRVLY